MNDSPGNHGEFERLARETFERSVGSLDARTCSQLNRARQAALAEVDRGERSGVRAWLPAGALAATAALALVLWQSRDDGRPADDVAASAAIIELPASDEDLDLVSEDPEFYAWSAQQASLVTNGSG